MCFWFVGSPCSSPPSTDQPTLVAAATATGGATGSAPRQLLGLRVLANPDPATATAELLHVLRSQSGNHSATARPTTITSASWPASITAKCLRTKWAEMITIVPFNGVPILARKCVICVDLLQLLWPLVFH